MKLLLLFLLGFGACREDCTNDVSCSMESNFTTPFESEAATETTEFVEEQTTTSSTTTVSTTTSIPTTPTPTLPPAIAAAPKGSICWCDLTLGSCDYNCCCDIECSTIQKHVFTSCADTSLPHDPHHCYTSDFIFRTPSSVYVTRNKNDMFCVVKDNAISQKEYEHRRAVKSLAEFDRIMRRRRREFSVRETTETRFKKESYKYLDPVWAISYQKLIPLLISAPIFGDLCLTTAPVHFLKDSQSTCSLKFPHDTGQCQQAVRALLQKISDIKIISSPDAVNITSIDDCESSKTCLRPTLFHCQTDKPSDCQSIESIKVFPKPSECSKFGLHIIWKMYHNGTEGIQKTQIHIRLVRSPMLTTEIRFFWSGSDNEGFAKSGNPGYITGKPILAGRKVERTMNDTSLKEVIEMTKNPEGWLTIFRNEKGVCSNKREPVEFNYNVVQTCFLPKEKRYFSKNGCVELQSKIYQVLLGERWSGPTQSYVGVFGNSRVEFLEEWQPIFVDNFPQMACLPSFENLTHLYVCRNIFTALNIYIATAKFGSFSNPQTKIVGITFRFGQPRNIYLECLVDSCEKSKLRLTAEVKFSDLTRPAVREFAQPPGLEARLPSDFFYPFFSGSSKIIPTKFLLASLLGLIAVFSCFASH